MEGETLEQRIAGQGPLPVNFALQLCLQISDVFDYLHTRDNPIVFRDFKPGNVMLTPQEEVKLIDFGIARIFKEEASTDTKALGTPGYAAPEQYGKGQSGPRTDLYAFGATIHQALTGRDPTDEPFQFPPITDYRSDLPAEFVNLIESCLNLRSNERPESAFAVKRVLERLLGITGSTALNSGRLATNELEKGPTDGPSSESVDSDSAPPTPETPPTAATPATSLPVSAPLVRTGPVPQVLFSPKVLKVKELGHGDKATLRLKVKADRPVKLVCNSPALQVFPDQISAGSTTCTINLDSSQLESGMVFEGAVEVEEHDEIQVPIQANIQAPKASLTRVVSMWTLCALTIIPLLNFLTTILAGIVLFSTPKKRRQNLKLAWWLNLLMSFGWTSVMVAVGFGLSKVDWASVQQYLQSLAG